MRNFVIYDDHSKRSSETVDYLGSQPDCTILRSRQSLWGHVRQSIGLGVPRRLPMILKENGARRPSYLVDGF